MKKKLLTTMLAFAMICLQAQTLYVQPIGGEQVAFSIIENPKITFGNGTMTIQGTTFQLADVQNLSFATNAATKLVAVNFDDNFLVFPNPVSDELSLIVKNPQGMNFRIFDLNGRLLKIGNLNSTVTTINVQGFRKGTYLLNLEQNGQSMQSFRIIKQ